VVRSSLGIVAWAAAAANGIEFSNRGRVPADMIEKYEAAWSEVGSSRVAVDP
jgi:hypothetical protein